MSLSLKLIEYDVELIQTYLQANLPAALAVVSSDRTTVVGQMPSPREYFTYETANADQAPAIYIIGENQDFRIYDRKANFIDALSRVYVNAVVEAQKLPELQYTAYRYQAALVKLLSQLELEDGANTVSIRIKVVRATFSSAYTTSQQKNQVTGVFRKEVRLDLDIEHYEKLYF